MFPLLYRCFKLCSFYTAFHSELQKLKNIFLNNGYRVNVFDYRVPFFLHKVFTCIRKNSTAPHVVYLSLPLTGIHCQQIKTQLLKLFFSAHPQTNLHLVLFVVFPMFFFKDHVPSGLRSHVG